MTRAFLLVVFAFGLGGAACALPTAVTTGVTTAFIPTTDLILPPRPQNCDLDMILQGQPPTPYAVIGPVSTHTSFAGRGAVLGEDNRMVVLRLKERACMSGAQGLMQVAAASQGIWTCDGPAWTTDGSAVAFVYIDAAGHPLPPQNVPRIVVPPRTDPNPTAGGNAPAAAAQAAAPQLPPPAEGALGR